MHYFSTLFWYISLRVSDRPSFNFTINFIFINFNQFKNFSMTNTYCREYSIKTPDDGK